ncbi:MAG: hypothetical protein IH899_19320 [Planctomycetes bacterium]|nr:hypothetical protein [Planctomycetota bacterium]
MAGQIVLKQMIESGDTTTDQCTDRHNDDDARAIRLGRRRWRNIGHRSTLVRLTEPRSAFLSSFPAILVIAN